MYLFNTPGMCIFSILSVHVIGWQYTHHTKKRQQTTTENVTTIRLLEFSIEYRVLNHFFPFIWRYISCVFFLSLSYSYSSAVFTMPFVPSFLFSRFEWCTLLFLFSFSLALFSSHMFSWQLVIANLLSFGASKFNIYGRNDIFSVELIKMKYLTFIYQWKSC